jgi:hypothetical protein
MYHTDKSSLKPVIHYPSPGKRASIAVGLAAPQVPHPGPVSIVPVNRAVGVRFASVCWAFRILGCCHRAETSRSHRW